jgi:hypothetical protein
MFEAVLGGRELQLKAKNSNVHINSGNDSEIFENFLEI